MPHAALWVVQHDDERPRDGGNRFNAARGFVGGAASSESVPSNTEHVSMPHAALWVVQRVCALHEFPAGLVSMPHAALWVVQLSAFAASKSGLPSFNAARGFVGGAAKHPL